MSNPALLHLPLRGNLDGRDRNGVITAVASGPVRFSADGYEAEEGTTNYVANPVAGIDLSNMFIVGATVTRVTDQTDLHATAVRAVTNGSVSGEGVSFNVILNTFSSLSARTFIGSLSAKGSGTVRVHTRLFYTDSSFTIGAEINVALTSTPQRIVTPTVATDPAKTLSHAYVFIRTDFVQAITFWASKAQIEEKAHATSYADGSLGTGYSWASTAHASASTRAATSLSRDIGAVPASYALRYRNDGGAETFAYLAAPGAIGPYGTLALAGTVLTLTSTRRTALRDVMAFDRELTAQEQATLQATPEWSFGVLQPKLGGLLRIGMSMGLAISSVAAPAAIGIAREMGGLS